MTFTRPEKSSYRFVLLAAFPAMVALSTWTTCTSLAPTPSDMPDIIDADMTVDQLSVPAGRSVTVRNNAVVTVNGDAQINGTLAAENSRLTLMINGNLSVSGTIRAMHDNSPDLVPAMPLSQQPVGVNLVVMEGGVTMSNDAVIESNGNYVITDDPATLSRTPQELTAEIENVDTDDLPTFVPLPPEHAAFMGPAPAPRVRKIITQQGRDGQLAPVVVTGAWPPAGMAPPNGDMPVMILRFNGPRDVTLRDWTVQGPPAPNGNSVDSTNNPSNDSTGSNGRNGLVLNMRNNGGMIRVEGTVTLNLANGGRGGDATSVCASATGGNGGASGNLRMTGSEGIDMSGGTLIINPGRGGDGGTAIVNSAPPGPIGCPGMIGANAMARGGNGARNEKALFARGNVEGIENVQIAAVSAGNGGEAIATACDGAAGEECCDGGAGGTASATGGSGGAASLDVKGLPVMVGIVEGGRGGDATSTGGYGGDGGECKFDDGGNGGDGGMATASAGVGGSALSGIAVTVGGDGGDAIVIGGDGGNGGATGFGLPGLGGLGGIGLASGGTGGAPGGSAGQLDEADGLDGVIGGQIPTTLYCFDFAAIDDESGTIAPATYFGPVTITDGTQVGTLGVDLVDSPSAMYQKGSYPDHIGITNGSLCFRLSSLTLDSPAPGVIGGVRLEALYGEGIREDNPLIVRAEDAQGNVVGEESVGEIPNNQGVTNPEFVDVGFTTDVEIVKFQIIVPPNAFFTVVRVYLLDP